MYKLYIDCYKKNQIISLDFADINNDINSLLMNNYDYIVNFIINNKIDTIDQFIINNEKINPLLSLLAILIYNKDQNKALNQLKQLIKNNKNISIIYVIHAMLYILNIQKFQNNYKLFNFQLNIQNININIILNIFNEINNYVYNYKYNCFYFDRLIDYIYDIESFLIKKDIINSNIQNILFELKQKIIINYLNCNICGINILPDDYNQLFFNDLKQIINNNKQICNIHIKYFIRFFKEKSTYNNYIIHTLN